MYKFHVDAFTLFVVFHTFLQFWSKFKTLNVVSTKLNYNLHIFKPFLAILNIIFFNSLKSRYRKFSAVCKAHCSAIVLKEGQLYSLFATFCYCWPFMRYTNFYFLFKTTNVKIYQNALIYLYTTKYIHRAFGGPAIKSQLARQNGAKEQFYYMKFI